MCYNGVEIFETGSVQSCRTCMGASKLKYCQNCKRVLYCCAECQTQDWPRHKKECTEMKKRRKKFRQSNCHKLTSQLMAIGLPKGAADNLIGNLTETFAAA